MTDLALYESAKEALAAAVRIDEVLDIRSAAERAKAYARIAKDRQLQANAIELGARAERKLGILLRKVKEGGLLSQGGRPAERSNLDSDETGADGEPVFDQTSFTLAEIGVSKKLSSRAQQLAALDEAEFETVVSDKREKILSADAPIVSPPRGAKPVKADKPAKTAPLEPRRFHQFAFAVLSLSAASDRVGSRAIQFLARDCGLLVARDDSVDFTPEAEAAMGNILVAALSALGGQDQAGAGRRLTVVTENGSVDGGHVEAQVEQPPSTPLSTEQADAIIRSGYSRGASVAELAQAIGRPGNKAYVRNRARVMQISSRDNQRAAASAFATAQHAARKAGGGAA